MASRAIVDSARSRTPPPLVARGRGRPRKEISDPKPPLDAAAVSSNCGGVRGRPRKDGSDAKPPLDTAAVGTSGGNAKTRAPSVSQAPPQCPLERAAAAMKPTGLVGRLPCRDEEQNRINSHLRAAVMRGGTEQVLYMSGMPGTGKTASLVEAVRQLRSNPKVPSLIFAHVNAMRLGTPKAVFSDILSHLPDTARCCASGAHNEVHRFFSTRSKTDPVVVLLIDEIDQLVTRSQGVLYSVFDLLSIRGSRLVITAISNTMDLPERMLPRVASRFEIIRVDFWPYTRDQIQNILLQRLKLHDASKAFTADALKRCAARVAAGSGDVRKALQLCLRALEIFQGGDLVPPPQNSGQPISIDGGSPAPTEVVQGCHVDAAAKDLLYANPATSAIAGLSPKTRRFLVSVLLELRRKEAEVVTVRKAAARYEKLCKLCCGGGSAAASWTAPSSGSHAEDAELLAGRLLTMNLLTTGGASSRNNSDEPSGLVLGLGGGLDTEDLATALLNVEEDAGVRELLRD